MENKVMRKGFLFYIREATKACSMRWHLTRGSESKPSGLKKGRVIRQKKESMQRSWGTLGLGIVQDKQEDWGSWRKWSTIANWAADSEDVMIVQEVFLRTMLRINMYTRKREGADWTKEKLNHDEVLTADEGRHSELSIWNGPSELPDSMSFIHQSSACPSKRGIALVKNIFLHQWAISMGVWRLQEIIISVLKRRHINASTTPKERVLSHKDKNIPGTRLLQSHEQNLSLPWVVIGGFEETYFFNKFY